MEPLADRSIYHALGYSIFVYLEAVMTFERDLIEKATQVLHDTCETISGFRKKNSGGIIDSLGRLATRKISDYNQYTDLEVHAELCYAEVMLLRAILTLCKDENLVSFIKAGLKVKNCFQSFRYVWKSKSFLFVFFPVSSSLLFSCFPLIFFFFSLLLFFLCVLFSFRICFTLSNF